MTYVHPEREESLPDEVRYPIPLTPAVRKTTGVVAHVDRVNDHVEPGTWPVDADYSWDPAAKPTSPAEGSHVELGEVA